MTMVVALKFSSFILNNWLCRPAATTIALFDDHQTRKLRFLQNCNSSNYNATKSDKLLAKMNCSEMGQIFSNFYKVRSTAWLVINRVTIIPFNLKVDVNNSTIN